MNYSYGKIFYKSIYKKFFRILKYEDNKLLKIKYMILGVSDFLRGNYGKK